MTEPNPAKAHIARKGLDATGFTEDHAQAAANRIGSHGLIIAEYVVKKVARDDTGQATVTLSLTHVEPVPDSMEDSVREVQRALYRNRPDQQGQAALQGTAGTERTPEDAVAALGAQVEHDDDGNVTGVWDGNPDGPLDPPTGEDGLDGDDRPWPGDEPTSDQDTEGGTVSAPDFSGAKKSARKRG